MERVGWHGKASIYGWWEENKLLLYYRIDVIVSLIGAQITR